jgi:cation transport ATPase
MIDPKVHHALALAIAIEHAPRHPLARAVEVAQDVEGGHAEVLTRLAREGDEAYTRVLARVGALLAIVQDDDFVNPKVQPRAPKASMARLLGLPVS